MNSKLGLVKVGDIVRDTISGFEGVAVAATEWLNGCVRILIQPKKLHDGKPVESQTFDVEQLKVLKRANAEALAPTGGDRPWAVQRPNAKR